MRKNKKDGVFVNKNAFPIMNKAVIYARYSSHNQTEVSIDGQVMVCKDYAKQNDLEIVGIYADRAMTGTNDRRPEFQKMIADSSKKMFTHVIVYKTDRFSRNRYDSAIYKTKLKNNGVKVLYATEPNLADNSSILIESVLEGFSEFFSANLATNIARGEKQNALKAEFNGGQPPYGYKVENKKLVIDWETAPTLQKIFRDYANNVTMRDIVRDLRLRGIKTRNNNDFMPITLLRMLRNDRYTGIYRYTSKSEVIEVEGGIPALIDKNTFDIVQKRLDEHAKHENLNYGKEYRPLTGKMFCGECGSRIFVKHSKPRGGRGDYFYYVCSSKSGFEKCVVKSISQEMVDGMLIDCIRKEVFNKNTIKYIANKVIELQGKKYELPDVIESELQNTDKAINNLLQVIESGFSSQAVTDRLAELEQYKKDVVSRLNESVSDIIITVEHVEYFLSMFAINAINDKQYEKLLLNKFIKDVRVFKDKLEVEIYMLAENDNLTINRKLSFF